ncbi:MAG TPA: hypothetical protein VE954_09920, partial [Oligoflexus sp.]
VTSSPSKRSTAMEGASLASGTMPKAQRLTSETENVLRSIVVAVMDRSAKAGPLSYTKATESTRACL